MARLVLLVVQVFNVVRVGRGEKRLLIIAAVDGEVRQQVHGGIGVLAGAVDRHHAEVADDAAVVVRLDGQHQRDSRAFGVAGIVNVDAGVAAQEGNFAAAGVIRADNHCVAAIDNIAAVVVVVPLILVRLQLLAHTVQLVQRGDEIRVGEGQRAAVRLALGNLRQHNLAEQLH